MNYLALIFSFYILISASATASDTWKGLTVKPENRCSPYNKSEQYPYPQSVEDNVVASMGGVVYSPYSGQYFISDKETDIEHIVAASEAHDSGLCSASSEVKALFARDMLNLTLAEPKINRCGSGGKCGLDAAEWLPAKNKCWFANRILAIKSKYNLSVDLAEANTLDTILANCNSTEMIFYPKEEIPLQGYSNVTGSANALELYDDDNNGRITCLEAKSHGITPVRKGHLAYNFMHDRNKDGIVCN
ncbi:excalibur calcium-binding domain-containing protein [Pseudoalteromonas carrageenovora]|uniref:GmrSD restriction endonuclease domain-containing protein n=1 Tax=Pseudoalteromonas carrageenovora TaxID=227 RepID=UPI0026E2097F|nr:DUF1524 domain-containing protein [Pseudoalteromonas carrageenovora]MDO6636841.1 excalibur calcium-binding domain-containing protein [Pseudoalteromonas carrageenovora]MDO6649057.1 excalibur calcium-binding domain-containing protein [Pseudoalteromonas carrageenovora]